MQNFAKWLTRGCEFIAAMILAAIFVIFLLQIFARYTSKMAWLMPIEQVSNWMLSVEPLGWTLNLISLLWVWLIFFGCSFVVRERDHVTFDILYLALPDHLRRIAIIIVSLTMIFALLWSFFANLGCNIWKSPNGIKEDPNFKNSHNWREDTDQMAFCIIHHIDDRCFITLHLDLL
jgi:TRAP-type C4-dicarboxylate transport system permease small subunit